MKTLFLKKHSFYTTLGLIIFVVITLVMSVSTLITYNLTKTKIIEQMREDAILSAKSLQKNIAHLIEAYAINDYENVIQTELELRHYAAIVVEDYAMGKITGERAYVTGKMHLEDKGTIVDYQRINADQRHYLERCFKSTDHTIVSSSGETLGSITIYMTNELLNAELNTLVVRTIVETAVIAFILFFVLYMTIRYFVLRPLCEMIGLMHERDADGIPLTMMPDNTYKEISDLSTTINAMITKIQSSQACLREQHDELEKSYKIIRLILETIPDFLWLKDTKGVYVMCNPNIEKFFGAREEAIIGKTDYDFVDTALANAFRENDRHAIEEGQARVNEEWIYVADTAEKILLQTTKVPLILEDGTVFGVMGIGHDITHYRQLIQELTCAREATDIANKTKSEFLANMSHEIRTPMNAILGLSELALHEMNEEGVGRQKVEQIYQSGRLLLGILNDILDFSKIEAGELKLVDQPFYFDKLLDQLHSLLSQSAHLKSLALVFDISKTIETAYCGDDLRLRQILTNLIGNAIKFTDTGEVRLRIETVRKDNETCWLSFAVSDTGIGISHVERQKLFQAFSQANTSITRTYGGTGLGLIISQRLVWAMGGSAIGIASEKGRGTTFSFEVPFRACSDVEIDTLFKSKTVLHTDASLLQGHILLVEDNYINQEVSREQLRHLGLSCTIAANGVEAIEKVDKESFDVILMDIQMPIMDGFEATKHIRQTHPTIPIIALSAAAMLEDQHMALDAGMNGHLSKPINTEELRKSLLPYLLHVKRD